MLPVAVDCCCCWIRLVDNVICSRDMDREVTSHVVMYYAGVRVMSWEARVTTATSTM